MKKVIGMMLLLMLVVGMLGIAHAADPIVISPPPNDAVNGTVTITVDEDAQTANVNADGDKDNDDPLDGYAYVDSSGACYAEDHGYYNEDEDNDGIPDNTTCEDTINGMLPDAP